MDHVGLCCPVQIWDMRTKACIHTLTGHTDTVSSVACRTMDPQVRHHIMHSTSVVYVAALNDAMPVYKSLHSV